MGDKLLKMGTKVMETNKEISNELSFELSAENRKSSMGFCNDTLTIREIEVLGYISMHCTSEQIAGMMFVSLEIVETDIKSILQKFKVTHIADVMAYYKETK